MILCSAVLVQQEKESSEASAASVTMLPHSRLLETDL